MLDWDPEKRASAQQMLDHPWLKMPRIYETKMSDEEYQKYMER
jgi:serine/threonine protein kinase